MRFLVKLKTVDNEPAKISLDYRSRFISLLKRVFGTEEFSKDHPRPYTFAVYLGKEVKLEGDAFEGVKTINFRFSTGNSITAVKFYNGILKLKKKNYKHSIGSGKFSIEWIKEEKERPIGEVFKVLSPVVVERMGYKNPKDPEDRYVLPSEKGFEESLLENLIRRYTTIIGKEPKINTFRFEPLEVKEEVIRHYGGLLRGFLGKFRLVSDSDEILRFIYQYGIGVRTGQGFGYLEVENGEVRVSD
ncbi:CRISPR-associated endoribonuclease Cas6 [Hydrogenobacter hydrogenophilus]|uniref:CRISPR-associated protein, Cas6 family n=1 Tax=Hydrogenobacter hydrogenophilus TaxID=35835 RepID=A0A285P8A5_9AQUI|nr:CRISPR-associated endoribonuclease Cas6 [Hydrogenobacter hydrogenophilus]SNZ16111.1 CRISPR-associated protein, Cas6 family [Hydrogenobacter hydrogenophilus]